MLSVSLAASCLAAATIIYLLSKSDFWGPLANVKGPFLSRFTRLWELFQFHNGDYVFKNRRWHDKYGSVVRLAPGRYSISSPEAVKQVYGHGGKFLKAEFYDAFQNPDRKIPNIFAERNPVEHSHLRRQVSSLYSVSSLKQYEPFIEETTERFCSRLSEFASEGKTIDLPRWMQYYAFDVIGEISFNKSFNYLEAGSDHNGIVANLDGLFNWNAHFGHVPEFFDSSTILLQALGVRRNDTVLTDFIIDAVQKRTKEYEEEVKSGKVIAADRRDFLIKLIELQRAGKLEDSMIAASAGANIGAGSDTTGLTLGALSYFLIDHPKVLLKLREEMRTFASDGRMSNPVTQVEANKMPYLQALIKETLRMHAGVGQILARTVPPGGATIDGHFFPAGTTVGANAWVVNYDKTLFGNDADDFRPERWLEDPEKSKHMEANLLSFGGGSRTCIGKNISLLEISKLVPELYRRFDFELAGPKAKMELDSNFFVKQSYTVKVSELAEPF